MIWFIRAPITTCDFMYPERLSLTMITSMGDLIGFEGYLNTSTPYNRLEHNALWKSERRYHDFTFGNNELAKCEYPRFYDADGLEVKNLTNELVGCRDSDFDQVTIPNLKI